MGFRHVTHHLLQSVGKSLVGLILPNRAYWAVKLEWGGPTGKTRFQCELDQVFDPALKGYRPFDWSLDLVGTGDIKYVTELWLFCPPCPQNPQGNSARLPITEKRTGFQLKIANIDAFGATGRGMQSQIIGRVTDKAQGHCECFVWDADLQAFGHWETNIHHMGSWRPEIAPIGTLNYDVLGLALL